MLSTRLTSVLFIALTVPFTLRFPSTCKLPPTVTLPSVDKVSVFKVVAFTVPVEMLVETVTSAGRLIVGVEPSEPEPVTVI